MGVKKYLDIWTARKISESSAQDTYDGNDLTREMIDVYTQRKLKETLRYAVENSLFYQKRYSEFVSAHHGPEHGEDFMKCFESMPFTTAEDLVRYGPEFLCVRPAEISRIVTLQTGGSTGLPKRVYFTEEDQQLTVDYFENGMQLMVDHTDKVLILMPAKIPGSIGRLLSEGLGHLGVSTINYGLPQMNPAADKEKNRQEAEHLLELMEQEGVTSIVALPTHMRMLSEGMFMRTAEKEPCGPCGPESTERCVNNQKTRARQSSLKSVLLSAEYISDEDVSLIEKTFHCKVYEHYGMTEMGLGCAVSCGQGAGYHIREADLYIEVIDPETGQVIRDGSVGEVVFTTLTRKGMPFIRYRTGDYSRWILEECPCGSVLKRLAKVGPRKELKGYLKESAYQLN